MVHAKPLQAVAAAVLVLVSLGAQGKEPGELWEVTTEMSMAGMQGMALPPNTQRVCKPVKSDEPPGAAAEEGCKAYDVKTSGGKTSWKVRCDGPPPTSGSGEIIYQGKDRYAGSMRMSSPDGEMTMKYSGKRVGECDAGEMKRQVQQIEAQAAASIASSCEQSAKDGNIEMFDGPNAICKDAKQKKTACAGFSSRAGYERYAPDPDRLSRGAKFCGTTSEALRTRHCGDALKGDAFKFLARHCPDESQALAKRECAGRSYTALTGSKYQSFCGEYARGMLTEEPRRGAQQPAAAPADATTEAVKEGVQKLKGILGF